MSRWDENPAWKEFLRWVAAAGILVYVTAAMAAFFLLAEPFAVAVMESLEWQNGYLWLVFLFRLMVLAHIVGVIWFALKTINLGEGEWPN